MSTSLFWEASMLGHGGGYAVPAGPHWQF